MGARSHRILHPTCMKRGASRFVCEKQCLQGDFVHFLTENALFAKARCSAALTPLSGRAAAIFAKF